MNQVATIYDFVSNTKLNNSLSVEDETIVLLGLFIETLRPIEFLKNLNFYELSTYNRNFGFDSPEVSRYHKHYSVKFYNQSPTQNIFLHLSGLSLNKLKFLIKEVLSKVLNGQYAEQKDIEYFVSNYLCKLDIYTKKFIKRVLLFKVLNNEEIAAANGLIMLWLIKLRNEYDEYLNSKFRTPFTVKLNRFNTPL